MTHGMTFGAHVDNAIRGYLDTSLQIRTDVSATLFIIGAGGLRRRRAHGRGHLWQPRVKLPAGDMIVYPGDEPAPCHPITRGSRIASFFWTQSLVRDDTRRAMLFDLDMSIRRLSADHPEHSSVVSLTSIYHNLLRQWAEL